MVQYFVRALALGVTLVAGWQSARADATCASHWIGTPHGESVPRGGSIYVFDDQLGNGHTPRWAVTSDGDLQWTAVHLAEHVARIDYTTSGSYLAIEAVGRPDGAAFARYAVRADWQAPAARPAVVRYQHQRATLWDGCGFDFLGLEVSRPAAAFRVRWRQADREVQRILPARWREIADKTGTRGGLFLDLGEIQTGLATVDIQQLYVGGALAISAIHHDGTEVPIGGVPDWVRIRPDDFKARAMYTSGTTSGFSPPPAAAAVTTSDDGDDYPWPRWIGALIAIAALVLGRSARRR